MESTSALTFLLPAMMAMFSGLFLFLWRFHVASARSWSFGFGLCALAFVIPYIPVPVTLAALLSDAFFIAGFYFYASALLIQFRQPLYTRQRIAFALVYIAINFYVVLIEGSLHAELLLNDTAVSCLLGFALIKVMDRAVSGADRVLIVTSSLVVLDTLVRVLVFVFFLNSSDNLEDFTGSSYVAIMQVTTSAVGLLFALSVLGSMVMETLLHYRDDAERDPLTGLYNRRGFDRIMTPQKGAARADGVVVICDIDHFKQVNDRFGHGAGDQVIAELAEFLRGGLPAHAIPARFGGEEFVTFIPGASLAEAGILAQMIRIRFAARDWRHIAVDRQITVSFGVAAIADTEISPLEALVRADECLYAAKAAGRNQVVLEGGRYEIRTAPDEQDETVVPMRQARG